MQFLTDSYRSTLLLQYPATAIVAACFYLASFVHPSSALPEIVDDRYRDVDLSKINDIVDQMLELYSSQHNSALDDMAGSSQMESATVLRVVSPSNSR